MGIKSCGSNNHTASKPYTYAEVSKYYDLKGINESLKKMALVGGPESYGMRIQLKFKETAIGCH
jgi:hypothetical protein